MRRTIRDLRLARGLTQEELARMVEVSTSQLCKLENLQKGAGPEVVQRLCRALGCQPSDLLVAAARKSGGQPKVARDELRLLVPQPERIQAPRWTSACRLGPLRKEYPAFMRRMEPFIREWSWFLEEVPSESAFETILQLLELAHGAQATRLSTAGIGFDLWTVCDEDGRGGATLLRPALVMPDYVMIFQVPVVVAGGRPRMDALVLVREPQTTYIDLEVDGDGRNVKADEQRQRALGMVTLRIHAQDLLKGPSLTERLRAMGYCQPRTR